MAKKKKQAAETIPEAAPTEAPASAAAAPEPLPMGEGLLCRWDQLAPSPQNPRKTFEPTALGELAESIAAEGILENLLVRPAPGIGNGVPQYEIVAGERRWRSIGLLVDAGRWDPAAPNIPCVSRPLTDAQALVLAIVENVQRQDIDPVEEGEAFRLLQALDPATWTTETLAQRIGRTQRHVQKRLQLVTRLADPVKEALSKGEINLEQAKVFVLGDTKEQAKHLKTMKRADWLADPEQIREAMVRERVPVSVALFDVAQYAGEIVEDEDDRDENDRGARYFTDTGEFNRLQAAAIDAKIVELEAKWPWVDRLGEQARIWAYEKAPARDKRRGAVIKISGRRDVEIVEGVLRPGMRPEAESSEASRGTAKKKKAGPIRWLTQAQVDRVKAAKTLALRRAVAAAPKAALALTILGLATHSEVTIRGDGSSFGSVSRNTRVTEPKAETAARRALFEPLLAAAPKSFAGEIVAACSATYLGSDAQAAIFRALMALDEAHLLQLLAAAIAQRVGCWVENSSKPGDSALAIAIAEVTEAYPRLEGLWQPDEDYFKAYRRDTLLGLAIANGLGEGFNLMKKSEQVATLAHPLWTHRHFAELQFLDDKALAAAMAGPALMPPPAPAPAAPLARCRDCEAHEGGKHHKRCGFAKAGEKKVTAAQCAPEGAGDAAPLACRECGAVPLRKHKRDCALASEGKVSAASCEPAPPPAQAPAAALPKCRLCEAPVFSAHAAHCALHETEAMVSMPSCAAAGPEDGAEISADELAGAAVEAGAADPLDIPRFLDRRRPAAPLEEDAHADE